MKFLGLKFGKDKAFSGVPAGQGGWWPFVREAFPGAWQMNIEYKAETVLAFHAVFACTTLIASDISKLRVKLVREGSDDIWNTVPFKGSGYDYSVIKKPNQFQNRIQFFEHWVTSKTTRGNAYILKGRDAKGVVRTMHVLNPDLVTPLVSDSGDVYYQLGSDNLSGITTSGLTVPASEIIHDRYNCLFHPLVGLPPIFASGLAAYQGLKNQEYGAKFFQNMGRPSGILTAPGAISDENAARLKAQWETNYSGGNIGKVAVLADDMKYTPLAMTAQESQMAEQLDMSARIVCSTYHVPPFKIGLGDEPTYDNVQALNIEYLNSCLQKLIEDIELCLDEGLDMPDGMGTELDIEGLLRMDTKTQIDTLSSAVGAAIYSPNEARARVNMKPVTGGSSPMIQQQNYSLEALAKRDAQADPFGTAPTPAATPAVDNEKSFMEFALLLKKELNSGGIYAN